MVSGCHCSRLRVFAVVATMMLASTPLMGQSPPASPTPLVTPTSTPTPEPADIDSAPTPTPQPSAAPTLPEDGSTPADSESASGQPAGASDDKVPKKDQVTNPGDLAFTDYAPFDLDEIEPEPIRSKWGTFVAGMRGLARYSLFDGKVKFRLGGSFMVDATAGNGNAAYEEAYGPIDSGLGFRYGVLYAVGRVKDFNVSVGLDFGADPGIDSAWIEGAKGGLEVWGHYLGKLRIGYVGEPFSLERLGSLYDATFLERSLPVQTMAPGYNIGSLIHDSGVNGRISWAAGIFSVGQNNEKNASTSRLSLTGRVTFLPVYHDEGRKLIHVGLAVSSRSPTGSDIRYKARPEARYVDDLVDTGSFSATHQNLWGVEAATVRGPIWAAAEFISSDTSAQSVGDPKFHGGYVQVGWFITGESRPYQTNGGTFGRVLPLTKYGGRNPFKKRNGGAWEVAGRISHLDLDAGLIEGGKLTDFSAALNWYVNATVRVKLNYIYARPTDRGSANIILLRLQYNPW
jgi:phosphate-selective porin OprO/OprP